MPKKEEIGYGIVIVFVLVSLFFITLMVPFDTPTGAAVLGFSEKDVKDVFYALPFVNFILLVMLSIFLVGGSLMVVQHRRSAEEALEELPLMNRIELKEFVRESYEKGFKEEDIAEALQRHGWRDRHIEAVLRLF